MLEIFLEHYVPLIRLVMGCYQVLITPIIVNLVYIVLIYIMVMRYDIRVFCEGHS